MSIEKLSTNASLKQVMDKFEEISLLDLSSIDIVVLNELPTEVKEGQIVVISEKQPKSILFDFYYPSTSTEGDIFVKLFSTKDGVKNFCVGNDSKKISVYLFGAEQYIDGSYKKATSYIGENGTWVSMNNYYIVDSAHKLDISDYYTTGTATGTGFTAVELSISDYALKLIKPYKGSNYLQQGWFTLNNPIDLTGYSTFYVDLKGIAYYSSSNTEKFIVQLLSSNDSVISSKTLTCKNVFGDTEETSYSFSMDISSINKEARVKFMLQTQSMESFQVTVEKAYFN